MLFPNSYACLIKPVFFTLPFIPTPVAFIMPRSVGLGRHITKPRKPAMAKWLYFPLGRHRHRQDVAVRHPFANRGNRCDAPALY